MRMRPKVSIVIPIYNAEKYVGQTLDCVCCQTHKNLEIICVLDRPTDKSERIVSEYAARDKRIVVIRQPKNMGQAAARNVGAKAATGKYIHFMDADDLITIDFYERLAAASDETGSDVAVCDFYYEKFPSWSMYGAAKLLTSNPQDKFDALTLWSGSTDVSCRYLFNGRFWRNNKIKFPENMRSIEDACVIMPTIMKAGKVVQVPGPLYIYKNREGSIMTRPDAKSVKERRKNQETANKIRLETMEKYGIVSKPRIIRTVVYQGFFNLTILKKLYSSDGKIRIYLFGLKVLRIKGHPDFNHPMFF